MTHPQRLKNYIRSARKRAGLTQDDLAYLLGGRGGKMVSRYERFQREPMLPTALAFQAALGVPVHDLFAGIYEDARRTVKRRAGVMDMRLRRLPPSRTVERKRKSIGAIISEPAQSQS